MPNIDWENVFERAYRFFVRPIAGIESVVIDDKIHYFAYQYSWDEVLSPLFVSSKKMAYYAARKLKTDDGRHGYVFWKSLVDEPENGLGDFTLTRRDIYNFNFALNSALTDCKFQSLMPHNDFINGVIVSLFRESVTINQNIDGLASKFGVASGDVDDHFIKELIEYVAGRRDAPKNGDTLVKDAALIIKEYLHLVSSMSHKSWRNIIYELIKT
ncbi:hypothetical protein L4D15_23620 [Enterovibrio norvegicus]|uniref:hypothetical protein n=1 Tax=Enterovibrio norvegicus TaxID=188144 RepID=UPI003D0BD370